jgi:hypothetical protein
MTSASSSTPMIGCGDAVEETTMSASARRWGRSCSEDTEPPKRSAIERARSAWRLATKIVRTPSSARAWAVSSLVSPAPMITTSREARSWPMMSRASPTATLDTLPRPWPSAVSERTRLPVCSAAVNSRLVSGPVVPASSAAS